MPPAILLFPVHVFILICLLDFFKAYKARALYT